MLLTYGVVIALSVLSASAAPSGKEPDSTVHTPPDEHVEHSYSDHSHTDSESSYEIGNEDFTAGWSNKGSDDVNARGSSVYDRNSERVYAESENERDTDSINEYNNYYRDRDTDIDNTGVTHYASQSGDDSTFYQSKDETIANTNNYYDDQYGSHNAYVIDTDHEHDEGTSYYDGAGESTGSVDYYSNPDGTSVAADYHNRYKGEGGHEYSNYKDDGTVRTGKGTNAYESVSEDQVDIDVGPDGKSITTGNYVQTYVDGQAGAEQTHGPGGTEDTAYTSAGGGSRATLDVVKVDGDTTSRTTHTSANDARTSSSSSTLNEAIPHYDHVDLVVLPSDKRQDFKIYTRGRPGAGQEPTYQVEVVQADEYGSKQPHLRPVPKYHGPSTASTVGTGRGAPSGPKDVVSSTGVVGRGAAPSTGPGVSSVASGPKDAASSTGAGVSSAGSGPKDAASSTGVVGSSAASGSKGAASSTGAGVTSAASGPKGVASATGVVGSSAASGTKGATSSTVAGVSSAASGPKDTASSTGVVSSGATSGPKGATSSTVAGVSSVASEPKDTASSTGVVGSGARSAPEGSKSTSNTDTKGAGRVYKHKPAADDKKKRGSTITSSNSEKSNTYVDSTATTTTTTGTYTPGFKHPVKKPRNPTTGPSEQTKEPSEPQHKDTGGHVSTFAVADGSAASGPDGPVSTSAAATGASSTGPNGSIVTVGVSGSAAASGRHGPVTSTVVDTDSATTGHKGPKEHHKRPPKEHGKRPSKGHTKEPSKGHTKEPSKGHAKEPSKGHPKEPSKGHKEPNKHHPRRSAATSAGGASHSSAGPDGASSTSAVETSGEATDHGKPLHKGRGHWVRTEPDENDSNGSWKWYSDEGPSVVSKSSVETSGEASGPDGTASTNARGRSTARSGPDGSPSTKKLTTAAGAGPWDKETGTWTYTETENGGFFTWISDVGNTQIITTAGDPPYVPEKPKGSAETYAYGESHGSSGPKGPKSSSRVVTGGKATGPKGTASTSGEADSEASSGPKGVTASSTTETSGRSTDSEPWEYEPGKWTWTKTVDSKNDGVWLSESKDSKKTVTKPHGRRHKKKKRRDSASTSAGGRSTASTGPDGPKSTSVVFTSGEATSEPGGSSPPGTSREDPGSRPDDLGQVEPDGGRSATSNAAGITRASSGPDGPTSHSAVITRGEASGPEGTAASSGEAESRASSGPDGPTSESTVDVNSGTSGPRGSPTSEDGPHGAPTDSFGWPGATFVPPNWGHKCPCISKDWPKWLESPYASWPYWSNPNEWLGSRSSVHTSATAGPDGTSTTADGTSTAGWENPWSGEWNPQPHWPKPSGWPWPLPPGWPWPKPPGWPCPKPPKARCCICFDRPEDIPHSLKQQLRIGG